VHGLKNLGGEVAGSLLVQTRRLLRQFDLKARKGLGQHFLIDGEVLKNIIAAAELTSSDTIIEVGPGLGVLTRELAQRAGRVIAIELDNKLAALLGQTLTPFNNVTIINDDVLKLEPASLATDYKVVANLPYYITSPVLRHFLEASKKPQIMIVMVQKEVAETIAARPGEMSILSISVQLYGEPKIISYVPSECFYPPPRVDSAIVRIDLYPRPKVAVDEASFFELVRAGFSAPRKQLANSLAQGLGIAKAEVLSLLEAARISPQRRAQTLSLEEWARLLKEKKDV
jgi:16S rRNA (adenine1518-N6/adenine1519-N6)-dimethyltransferase